EARLHHRPAYFAGVRSEGGMVKHHAVRQTLVEGMSARWLLGGLCLAGIACKPEFAERYSNVAGPRVLAVMSEPAEADPIVFRMDIQYTALFVDQTGPRDDASIAWAFCTEPTPPSELNDVSAA